MALSTQPGDPKSYAEWMKPPTEAEWEVFRAGNEAHERSSAIAEEKMVENHKKAKLANDLQAVQRQQEKQERIAEEVEAFTIPTFCYVLSCFPVFGSIIPMCVEKLLLTPLSDVSEVKELQLRQQHYLKIINCIRTVLTIAALIAVLAVPGFQFLIIPLAVTISLGALTINMVDGVLSVAVEKKSCCSMSLICSTPVRVGQYALILFRVLTVPVQGVIALGVESVRLVAQIVDLVLPESKKGASVQKTLRLFSAL